MFAKIKIQTKVELPKTMEVGQRKAFDLRNIRHAATPAAQKVMKIEVLENRDDVLRFEFSGADLSFVNELRRILMLEVPVMAINAVEIHVNTSVIEDEVLCHRLGLVPIKTAPVEGSIIFQLRVRCEADPETEELIHDKVLAGDLVAVEDQPIVSAQSIEIAHPDVVLAPLAANQEISCTCHAQMGRGKDHAKFDPVAVATFRQTPQISFKKPIPKELADQFIQTCPMGVFDIEDGEVVVANLRACSDCRECVKKTEDEKIHWADYVKLSVEPDRFEFTIESTGARSARDLYTEAMKILIRRRQEGVQPEQAEEIQEAEAAQELEELEMMEKES